MSETKMTTERERDLLRAIRGCYWTVQGGPLEGDDVVAAYAAIRDITPDQADHKRARLERMARRCGFIIGSNRKWDRASTVLKRDGLIRYVRGHGWAPWFWEAP